MKKTSALVFASLLILLTFTAALPAQDTPSWWDQVPAEQKRVLISGAVSELQAVANGKGMWDILEYAKQFPFDGIGVSLQFAQKSGEESIETAPGEWGVQMGSVYLGLPAAQSGIQSGDWLLTVWGEHLCTPSSSTVTFSADDTASQRDEKEALAETCVKNAAKFIKESGNAEVLLQVEREGTVYIYTVARTKIGQEIADFIIQKLPGWEKFFDQQREPLEKLQQRLAATGDDDQQLLACLRDLKQINEALSKPMDEMRAVEKASFIPK